jgi:peptidylprolyl isomerase
VVKDLIVGHGKAATTSSTVTVNYVGVLYKNGKEFDSSWKRGQPTSFPLSGVIPGWTQGIPGMKVGGRRELIIPPSLAYKNKANGPIPANSTLVFVIDLLSVS